MFERNRVQSRRRGFTMIEASLTTVIIGVGVAAVMQLLAAGTINNIQSFETTTGVNVGKAFREVTLQKSMSEVIAMNGTYHEPPWDSRSQAMTDLTGWRQSITVQPVSADNLTLNIADANPTAVRVTVMVTHDTRQVCDISWYTFKAAAP